MTVGVIKVNSQKQINAFIRFPQELYKDHKNYVSEFNWSVKDMITDGNPFLKHSQSALFLAFKANKIVGRIAAIYNTAHLKTYKDETGFFGFFDSINDVDVAKALFQAAGDWLKTKGITQIVGPTNLTTNDSCGVLINGFEYPPMVSMPYNFDYYHELCVQCGYKKKMDLFSYNIDGIAILEKYGNVLTRSLRATKNNGIVIRPVSSNNFKDDMKKLRVVYNTCNENNWGFVPLNENEFLRMAKELKMIAPLDLAILVEKNNEIIGFVVAVPDINQALKHVHNGKIFPLGLLKFLWYKRKIKKARVMLLGVLKEYGGQGIDLILYQKITEALAKHKIYEGEASFVLESNKIMNSVLEKIGGKRIKEYRIYNKSLLENMN
ncbi:MAG: hypothetical protein MUP24_03620 [Gillisia sp.]|nr:hypothetical protein [Gillisia sp.]